MDFDAILWRFWGQPVSRSEKQKTSDLPCHVTFFFCGGNKTYYYCYYYLAVLLNHIMGLDHPFICLLSSVLHWHLTFEQKGLDILKFV